MKAVVFLREVMILLCSLIVRLLLLVFTVVRQIVSEETSKTVRALLENAVDTGSGQNAYIKGYRVAGKTGTSEKTPRGNGKYVASFIGIAPSDEPEKTESTALYSYPERGVYAIVVMSYFLPRSIRIHPFPTPSKYVAGFPSTTFLQSF